MAQNQLATDVAENKPDTKTLPDDWRKADGPLRHTTGAERQHRDRGMANTTPGWRQHLRDDKD